MPLSFIHLERLRSAPGRHLNTTYNESTHSPKGACTTICLTSTLCILVFGCAVAMVLWSGALAPYPAADDRLSASQRALARKPQYSENRPVHAEIQALPHSPPRRKVRRRLPSKSNATMKFINKDGKEVRVPVRHFDLLHASIRKVINGDIGMKTCPECKPNEDGTALPAKGNCPRCGGKRKIPKNDHGIDGECGNVSRIAQRILLAHWGIESDVIRIEDTESDGGLGHYLLRTKFTSNMMDFQGTKTIETIQHTLRKSDNIEVTFSPGEKWCVSANPTCYDAAFESDAGVWCLVCDKEKPLLNNDTKCSKGHEWTKTFKLSLENTYEYDMTTADREKGRNIKVPAHKIFIPEYTKHTNETPQMHGNHYYAKGGWMTTFKDDKAPIEDTRKCNKTDSCDDCTQWYIDGTIHAVLNAKPEHSGEYKVMRQGRRTTIAFVEDQSTRGDHDVVSELHKQVEAEFAENCARPL